MTTSEVKNQAEFSGQVDSGKIASTATVLTKNKINIHLTFAPESMNHKKSLWKSFFLPLIDEFQYLGVKNMDKATEDVEFIIWYASLVKRVRQFLQLSLESKESVDVLLRRVSNYIKKMKLDWLDQWKTIHENWRNEQSEYAALAEQEAKKKRLRRLEMMKKKEN